MIAIIDYGMGNLRSVQKAFEYVGCNAVVTQDLRVILDASHVVLPGVGAFRDAMESLRGAGLLDAIYRVVDSGRPFLGICLGLQLLFERSYEGGVSEGLALLPGEVKRLPEKLDIKIPHMGWNELKYKENPVFEGLSHPCYVYFVHSYYVEAGDQRHVIGTTFYGMDIAVAVNKNNIYGLQFHPEKSGAEGLKMLENFARLK